MNDLRNMRRTTSDQVRKRLRHQSKDFYAVGFDALVKRQDKCINVCREYVDKYSYMLSPGSNIAYFPLRIHL
jgi:hypothetical protein